MTTSPHFSMLVKLLYEIDYPQVSKKMFMRHRAEYEYILSQIQLASYNKVDINMNSLLRSPMPGSQPTVSKRVNELESLQLITSEKNDDQRMRTFKLTKLGEEYLEQCSQILQSLCLICLTTLE